MCYLITLMHNSKTINNNRFPIEVPREKYIPIHGTTRNRLC